MPTNWPMISRRATPGGDTIKRSIFTNGDEHYLRVMRLLPQTTERLADMVWT